MKAQILAGAKTTIGYLPPGETSDDVLAELPAEDTVPTDDPSRDGKEVPGPSVRHNTVDADSMKKWVAIGGAVEQSGRQASGVTKKFSYLAMLAMGTSGAIVGSYLSVLGPYATLIGFVVGMLAYVIIWAWMPGTMGWDEWTPGLHEWFTVYGPQEFLDFVRSDQPELKRATQTSLVQALLMFWLQRYAVVITDAPGSFYSGIPNSTYISQAGGNGVVADIYSKVGVDYRKTRLEGYPAGAVVDGQTSQGLGGVWMLTRKVEKFTGDRDGLLGSFGSVDVPILPILAAGAVYLLAQNSK